MLRPRSHPSSSLVETCSLLTKEVFLVCGLIIHTLFAEAARYFSSASGVVAALYLRARCSGVLLSAFARSFSRVSSDVIRPLPASDSLRQCSGDNFLPRCVSPDFLHRVAAFFVLISLIDFAICRRSHPNNLFPTRLPLREVVIMNAPSAILELSGCILIKSWCAKKCSSGVSSVRLCGASVPPKHLGVI